MNRPKTMSKRIIGHGKSREKGGKLGQSKKS